MVMMVVLMVVMRVVLDVGANSGSEDGGIYCGDKVEWLRGFGDKQTD